MGQGGQGRARESKGELSDAYARTIAAHTWDVVENMQELGTPVGSATADLWLASKPRDEYAEIEDDLIVAACMRIGASYLVTNDAKLMRHAPVAAVTPKMMTAMLRVRA